MYLNFSWTLQTCRTRHRYSKKSANSRPTYNLLVDRVDGNDCVDNLLLKLMEISNAKILKQNSNFHILQINLTTTTQNQEMFKVHEETMIQTTLKMGHPSLFFIYFCLFVAQKYRKLAAKGIQTWIVGSEGKDTDHYTIRYK